MLSAGANTRHCNIPVRPPNNDGDRHDGCRPRAPRRALPLSASALAPAIAVSVPCAGNPHHDRTPARRAFSARRLKPSPRDALGYVALPTRGGVFCPLSPASRAPRKSFWSARRVILRRRLRLQHHRSTVNTTAKGKPPRVTPPVTQPACGRPERTLVSHAPDAVPRAHPLRDAGPRALAAHPASPCPPTRPMRRSGSACGSPGRPRTTY